MQHQSSMRAVLIVLACSALAVIATPSLTLAQDTGGWSVDPGGDDGPGARSSFVYTLKPGQTFQDVVSVSNTTTEPLTLDIYATDAYNTPVDAAFALLEDDVEPSDAGSWVTTAVDELTIEPGTRADIPFQVSVPIDASPGDHTAGIIAANDEPEPDIDESGAVVAVRRRVAARMYIRVAGPLEPELQVVRVDVRRSPAALPPVTGGGRASVVYEIRNSGNVRLTPTAQLKVSGFLGRSIITFDEDDIPELLPGSSVLLVKEFQGLPPLERLRAKVEVDAEVGPNDPVVHVSASQNFWVVSWGFALLLLATTGLLIAWRRQRRHRSGGGDDDSPALEVRELVNT